MLTPTEIRMPIEAEFRMFEKAFEQAIVPEDNPVLEQLWQYISSRRGKQMRPQLVLLSAALCRGITSKTIDVALALEMTHTASLVHDDVVDHSPTRRGTESVQAHWTNKIAVLAGDYLLAKAIEFTSRAHNQKIISIIAELGQQLADGELLQLHADGDMWISTERYYSIIEKKTADLFAACTKAGAISAGATERQINAVERYGLYLGMCFQLKDDALDYSDSEQIGKPTMSDIRDGKVTLPLIVTMERCTPEEAQHLRQLCEHPDAEACEEIKNIVMRYDGIGATCQAMLAYKEKAVKALEAFHDSKYKESLLNLLDYTIQRIS